MKINNRGITLLEVIIAMAILSVVIFMGYKVANGSDKVADSQKHITKGQLSTNLVNKYVSKDIEILEAKKDIEFRNDSMIIESDNNKYIQNYTYIIDIVNHDEGGSVIDKVEYNVAHNGEIKNNEFRGIYSVIRKSKEEDGTVVTDVELVSNQKTMYTKDDDISSEKFLVNSIRPFTIYKDNEDINLYTVGVHYESNSKEKNYVFDVSPRMSLVYIEPELPIGPEPPAEPEIDPDFDGNSAYIRFKQENGFAWSDAGPKSNSANNLTGSKYSYLENTQKIYAVIESGTSNGKVTTSMENGNSNASAQNSTEFPKENYNQIKISLFGDVTIENLKITANYKGKGGSYNPTIDKNIIDILSTRNGFGQDNIVIEGNIKFKEGSNYGDIIINLGHKKG